LLNVLETWRRFEHRIRHARTALEKGEAIPADLKHIIVTMERAMQPLPVGTELYFATYDQKTWKYNPEWWLPCSRTAAGAEMAKRHHQPPPTPNAKVIIHKLVVEECIPAVWAGGLGGEHDDEEEIVLAADLVVSKSPGKSSYRVSLSDTPHAHRHGRDHHESESEAAEQSDEDANEAAKVVEEKEEKKEEKPASTSYCIVS
jgi:hypothetical protein